MLVVWPIRLRIKGNMTEKEVLSPGGEANKSFVTNMKAEHPELAELIPDGCLDCSSAWLHATAGRIDRVQACQGKSKEAYPSAADKAGKFTVMLCHLPSAR